MPQQSLPLVRRVLAAARITADVIRQRRQPQRCSEFALGNPAGVRGDGRTVELQLQAAVEIDPHSTAAQMSSGKSGVIALLRDVTAGTEAGRYITSAAGADATENLPPSHE